MKITSRILLVVSLLVAVGFWLASIWIPADAARLRESAVVALCVAIGSLFLCALSEHP